jgi:hypothetical protein|nr:MAG TPA: hypothetical protein [Bacteriophage sp.]DAS83228.1 MAG TPA: hypothetical protein [Caudoviricetes sp.]DAZ80819.1 MAG TPA: hypothetical protein [Caudoviricetes sp.]
MSKTTNNAKVDFFQSARTLSTRTSEFFRCIIKKAELNTIYGSKIDANNNSIAAIDDMLEKGTNLDVTVDDLNRMRANYVTINEGLKVEWDKLLKEQASFEYNEHDKKFRKAMKDATCLEDVKIAVASFYKAYKLDVSGTTFEIAVLESIGKKIDTKTVVKSNGTKALKYDVTNALKNLYGVGFEWMVEAGTIKPADIPSVLTDKYTKKSKKNNK